MIEMPRYEVRVRIDLNERSLAWPEQGHDLLGESLNPTFSDLSTSTWEETETALAGELHLLNGCVRDAESVEHLDQLLKHYLDGDEEEDLSDDALEFGVGAPTFALNAAGCFTILSCNGHGAGHGVGYPYVLFCVRPGAVPLLIAAAGEANVGLINGRDGCCEVFSDRMDGLLAFAAALVKRAPDFRHLPPRSAGARPKDQLLIVFDDDSQERN